MVGTQKREALAKGVRQILLLLTLQQRRADDDRRTQLLLVASADEFHVARPILAQVQLRDADAQNLAGIDEHPRQH